MKRFLALLPLIVLAFMLSAFPGAASGSETLSWNVDEVLLSMQPLMFDADQAYRASVQNYFNYYGIAFEGIRHNFGTISAGAFTIATHVYTPPDPVGTVYLVHGYLDHTGLLARLIGFLLDLDLAVVVYDLPGHGLSSGQQAGIDDFSQYGEVFNQVYERTKDHVPRPHNLVAHSTGCSTALDLIQEGGSLPFKHVVMLAPLVRSAFYGWSRAGTEIAGSLVESVGRRFRRNSSDRQFVAFVRKDPLQSKSIPMSWVRAYHAWSDRIKSCEVRPADALIIQGTEDVIVQWKYNMKFLKEKLPNARMELIEGANHQLMNEAERLRGQVFDLIVRDLEGQ